MAGVQNFALRVNEDGFVLMPGIDQNLDRTSGAGHPNPMEEHSVKRHPLGTVLWDPSGGRMWKYALNGGVALIAGGLGQSKVPTSGHENIACGTEPAGETTISVTPVTGNVIVDSYDEGFLYANDGQGEGELHPILTTPAITASAAGNIELYANDPIVTAFEAGTLVTLHFHPYSAVIVHPSPNTAAIVGCPNIPVTADYYFWAQVSGPCPVLGEGTLTIGEHVRASDASLDGSVEALIRAGSSEDEQDVGVVMNVGATTDMSLIQLTIAAA